MRHHKSNEESRYKDEENGKNNMAKIKIQNKLQLA